MKDHVEGQTYEPVPAYHMAKVYAANGMGGKAKTLYLEALKSGYELGPVAVSDIQEELKSM